MSHMSQRPSLYKSNNSYLRIKVSIPVRKAYNLLYPHFLASLYNNENLKTSMNLATNYKFNSICISQT